MNECKSLWKTVKKSRPSLLPSSFSSYSTASKFVSFASVFSSVFVLCKNIWVNFQHIFASVQNLVGPSKIIPLKLD